MVSIITINYNNADGLRKTIESVIDQRNINYEYIIIDGGSADGSKEIIKKYSDKLSYWVSEKDAGIYNAMNKGIRQAKGAYCLFLNSGDYFFSGESLYKLWERGETKDLIYGNIVVEDSQQWVKRYPSRLTFGYFLKDTLPHPATLIKTDLLRRNPYNEENKIASDWEFFVCSVCLFNASYQYVDTEISVFNLTGISSDESNFNSIRKEKEICLSKYFNAFMPDYQEMDELKRKLNMNPVIYYLKKRLRKLFV